MNTMVYLLYTILIFVYSVKLLRSNESISKYIYLISKKSKYFSINFYILFFLLYNLYFLLSYSYQNIGILFFS